MNAITPTPEVESAAALETRAAEFPAAVIAGQPVPLTLPVARKKPNRRRRHVERFRTDDAEHAELERRARDAGLTVHAYCRMRTLGEPGPRARRRAPVDATALAQGLVAFNRQHNNYNQAVRALNKLALIAEDKSSGDVLRELRDLRALIEGLQGQFAAPVAAILDAMRHDREG
jgi:hypothetical protein